MPAATGAEAMVKEKKGKARRPRGAVLFIAAFGLTVSVLVGFSLGYLSGRSLGREPLTGVVGALVGFLVGIAGLIFLAKGEN